MAIYKSADFITNIDSNNIDVKTSNAKFYTEDKNTSQIRIYVKWNGRTLNLNTSKLKPQLDLFLEDESIFIDEPLNIMNGELGLIQYMIPDKVIKHHGKVNCKLFLKGEDKSVHVANFSFNIHSSGVEDMISKEVSVNLVEDTVKKIMNESPELFKGEKGDKLTFDDLTPENKEELRGKQGPKGDTLLAPPRIYTRDEYNQLETKDSNTLYFISEV